jgi:hypothetical protein
MPGVIFKTKLAHFNKPFDMHRFLPSTPGMKHINIVILLYSSQSFVIL